MEILVQITFLLLVENVNPSCLKGSYKNGKLESEKNGKGFYFIKKKYMWNLCTFVNHKFFIEFDRFDLAGRFGPECDDFVKITDNSNKKILFNRCGLQHRPHLQSDSNNITIEFHTDKIPSNNTGFRLSWYIIEKYQTKETTTLNADNHRTKVTKRYSITTSLKRKPSNPNTSSYGDFETTIARTKRYTTAFEQTILSVHTKENEKVLPSTQPSHIRSSSSEGKNTKPSYYSLRTNKKISCFNHETSKNALKSTKVKYMFPSIHATASNARIYTASAESEKGKGTDGVENTTTGIHVSPKHDEQPPLFLIGIIVIGGILLETTVVSVACTLCRKRRQKRWSVKRLSRTKDKNEGVQAWWSRPKSLSLSYNERLSYGNLYSEINIQEMISFQTDDTTATNTEFNKCPYEEVIRRDGEYDHIGKHREKRKSFLDKLNVYGLHRVSNVFRDN